MSVSPARETAYRVLRRVESGRGFAVDLLQNRQVSGLREDDRRLATELVMGVLRSRGELDFQMERISAKPLKYFDAEVRTILQLGIYQIRFLDKIPKPAIVNEAVEMTKAARKGSAAGLVNAVLRKCSRPDRRPNARAFHDLDSESKASACRLVPAWMFERWSRHFGPEAAKALAWQSSNLPPTTLRVTAGASNRDEVRRELEAEGIKTRPGQYGSRALIVESGNIQGAQALDEGCVVIQDEASQLVGELVAVRAGQTVVDLCAAPGIKASQLSDSLGAGRLVAADTSARRLRTMAKLMPRMSSAGPRVHFVRLDATHELPFSFKFDRILLDVPCSGTGTLARNPEIKYRLEPEDLLRLATTQASMLRNALALLAPGGRLVYATCSLEPEENEQVIEQVLREAPGCRVLSAAELSREHPALSALFDSQAYFRTRPDLHSMDGFFASVIVRGE